MSQLKTQTTKILRYAHRIYYWDCAECGTPKSVSKEGLIVLQTLEVLAERQVCDVCGHTKRTWTKDPAKF